MKSKKRKEPPAQQLIDSLLDESTPSPHDEREVRNLTESVHLGEPSIASRPSAHSKTKEVRPTSLTTPSDPSAEGLLGHPIDMDTAPHFGSVTHPAKAPEPPQAKSRDSSRAHETQVISRPAPRARFATESANESANESAAESANEATSTAPGAVSGSHLELETDHKRRDEGTERLAGSRAERSAIDRQGITELKTVIKMRDRFPSGEKSNVPPRSAGPTFGSSEASLKQSESLRIAQTRISELEHEIERTRRDNEQLGSAGETLRRRADELLSKVEQFELQRKELERTHSEEKKVYRGQLQAKDRENAELRGRLEEMENRLESNFKKIRVRERELEHRLEIVRMESQTLIATKDKMILELKRHVDQIVLEGDYAKQKSQEMFNQYKEKQETIRRVVRALRIALTILEGDDDAAGIKKNE